MKGSISRRRALTMLAATSAGLLGSGCASRRPTGEHIVIVGGGFGGASCARTLRALNPSLKISLIESSKTYTACPFSNLVIAGLRQLQQQQFSYSAIKQLNIDVIHQRVTDIDAEQSWVQLRDGRRLYYTRLVLAPGIDIAYDQLPGYDIPASRQMPHAWKAGAQTLRLARQVAAMPDGGLFVMAIPDNPYRCPPGPYERASLIAHTLLKRNPRAKVLLLDSKDQFSKQTLFTQAWQNLYGSNVEWQGRSDGASVTRVEASTGTLHTDFEQVSADVANVIPPQRAGQVAMLAGATDASGWCPVVAETFASTQVPRVHVIGDAAIANAMPKSAFAANAQARLCALQISRELAGMTPVKTKLLNTCYSLVKPDYGISVAGVYRPEGQYWRSIAGAGGASDLKTDTASRLAESDYARAWFGTLTGQVYE